MTNCFHVKSISSYDNNQPLLISFLFPFRKQSRSNGHLTINEPIVGVSDFQVHSNLIHLSDYFTRSRMASLNQSV